MDGLIQKVLVPNRGEIAIRIARTCREMRIATVLGAAEDEKDSPAARYFDAVELLGSGDSRQTYLNVAAVIDAARRSGADAIHPGYGFLSERAELSQACVDAGIRFIGPYAESIDSMGSKAESRKLMQRLGVPTVPGYDGEDQALETLLHEAAQIGYPLLVKASAGGGGKGMKIVRNDAELAPAIDSAKREATKSFGNDRLLLERYIENPRHVEFQIFGDTQGGLVHLYERDCSIQRRHQKVIEETPAPHYSEDLRQRMAAAAVAAARGVKYVNAGTVEFIVTPTNEFYFLEMNTRLQVEHPVTELVCGVDLVRAQLLVASGQPLPWKQEQLTQRGHALQCRIYAEDPDNGFLPQIGTIARYVEPRGPGIRVDSGVEQGSEVTVKYDPMLAKLICFGEDRNASIDRMELALRQFIILGTRTNTSFLRRVIDHPAFRKGEVSTSFLTQHAESLRKPDDDVAPMVAAAIDMVGASAKPAAGNTTSNTDDVWTSLGTWGRGV